MRGLSGLGGWRRVATRGFCALVMLLLAAGCAAPPPFQQRADDLDRTFSHPETNLRRHTYLLQFDYNGHLSTPFTTSMPPAPTAIRFGASPS